MMVPVEVILSLLTAIFGIASVRIKALAYFAKALAGAEAILFLLQRDYVLFSAMLLVAMILDGDITSIPLATIPAIYITVIWWLGLPLLLTLSVSSALISVFAGRNRLRFLAYTIAGLLLILRINWLGFCIFLWLFPFYKAASRFEKHQLLASSALLSYFILNALQPSQFALVFAIATMLIGPISGSITEDFQGSVSSFLSVVNAYFVAVTYLGFAKLIPLGTISLAAVLSISKSGYVPKVELSGLERLSFIIGLIPLYIFMSAVAEAAFEEALGGEFTLMFLAVVSAVSCVILLFPVVRILTLPLPSRTRRFEPLIASGFTLWKLLDCIYAGLYLTIVIVVSIAIAVLARAREEEPWLTGFSATPRLARIEGDITFYWKELLHLPKIDTNKLLEKPVSPILCLAYLIPMIVCVLL